MNKVVFSKDGGHNLGNIVSNTINIKPGQQKVLTIGTLWIPIFEGKDGAPYINRIMEVVGTPTPAVHKTIYNAENIKSDYNMQVKVRTRVETLKPHYLSKKAKVKGWGQLTYGNTSLTSNDKGTAKKALYNEYNEFCGFALRGL